MPMRLQIEPTGHIADVDGVQCRIWNGVSESGAGVIVFVATLAVKDDEPPAVIAQFERELLEIGPPRIVAL